MKRIIPALILTFASLPAHAHPHVWITAKTAAILDASGNITGIRNIWTMDEDYSLMATEGLDTDGDGKFSPAELEPLSRENLEALKEFEFFTYAYIEITVEKTELAGAPPASCQSESIPADQSGDVFATKTMLADKPPDWQPPVEQDFGALFADTVKITCDS